LSLNFVVWLSLPSSVVLLGNHSPIPSLQIKWLHRRIELAIVWRFCNDGSIVSSNEKVEAMRLKDIAERLNVSVSTVSRALGKDTSDKVAPELRAKIVETARQVNYVPHPAAQLMRKPKVHLITALLPFETGAFVSEFYGAVLSGVVAASREWETETRVALIDPNDADILEETRRVALGAGAVFYMAKPLSVRQLVKLEDLARPIVVMGGSLPAHIDLSEVHVNTVGVNNLMAAYEVTIRLLKLGHRRLALINGPAGVRDAWEREQGFAKALKEHNVSFDPHAIIHGTFTTEGGVRGWEQLKLCSERPTAIVCGDDEIAFGVLEALAKDRIDCPHDVSVVGFDDSRWAPRVSPALTTVRQPTAEMGRAAVELLATRLQDPSGAASVEHRVFPVEIVNRQSVAPPP
jgi:DNA-binding LacI/PurR family transcriptional regulator